MVDRQRRQDQQAEQTDSHSDTATDIGSRCSSALRVVVFAREQDELLDQQRRADRSCVSDDLYETLDVRQHEVPRMQYLP